VSTDAAVEPFNALTDVDRFSVVVEKRVYATLRCTYPAALVIGSIEELPQLLSDPNYFGRWAFGHESSFKAD